MAEPLRDMPTSPGDAWRPPAKQEHQDDLRLPGYSDVVRVSAGTGSRVYRAWQGALDRPVAVKVLHLDDPEAIQRFEREIDITVQLGRRHPNIVTVLDIGTTADGKPYIVMDYYDAGSLHDRLRAHGPLRPKEVLEAGIVVADALWFAHGQGVLHRDVKPQNILVLPTSYVLADFGIARRADATQHTSSVDWFTFQHASPQVIEGEAPNEQDDIWSVGSTLFTLLDGRPPHAGDLPEDNKPLAYMRRVRTAAVRPLNRTDVPEGLREIIARCLRPEREDRFATAADLGDALLVVQAQERAWAPGPAQPPQAQGMARPPQARARLEPPPQGQTGAQGLAGLRGHTGPEGLTGARGNTGAQGLAGARGQTASRGPAPVPELTMQRPVAPMTPAELANLVASAASAGYPIEIQEPLEEPPPLPVDDPPRSARGKRLAVAAVAALLAGTLAGAIGTLVVKQANNSAQTPAPQVSEKPGGSALPNINDVTIAPVLETVQLSGTTVRLKWRDPTQGKATFVVVRVEGGEGIAVIGVQAGQTETTLEGVQAQGPVCYLILSLMEERKGASPTKCSGATSQ